MANLKDRLDIFKDIIINGSVDDIRKFMTTNFHAIKHTDSFALLLNRLEKSEQSIHLKIPDLKDCPFCGGKAIVVSNPGQNWDGKLGKGYIIGGMHGLWYVGCPHEFFECEVPHCEIHPSASWFARLEDAIKEWNNRND
jgi:hypothetical protein